MSLFSDSSCQRIKWLPLEKQTNKANPTPFFFKVCLFITFCLGKTDLFTCRLASQFALATELGARLWGSTQAAFMPCCRYNCRVSAEWINPCSSQTFHVLLQPLFEESEGRCREQRACAARLLVKAAWQGSETAVFEMCSKLL